MCLAVRSNDGMGDLEVAFKGGQVGTDDYFRIVRDI